MEIATISLPPGANDAEKIESKSRRADIDWPQARKLIRVLGFGPTADLLECQENTLRVRAWRNDWTFRRAKLGRPPVKK